MRKLTLLAAAVLGVSSLAQAEPTAPVAPAYGPFQAMQAQHLAAMKAAMARHSAMAPGYGDSAIQERALEDLTQLNERIASDMATMQEQMRQAATLPAPEFDAAPMTREDMDALFAERRQEMEAHFAEARQDLDAPTAPEAPEFPSYVNDGRFDQLNGRFEEMKAEFEASRKEAEARMSEAREALKERVQARSTARTI